MDLLDALCARPDDDDALAVYADWLTGKGQALGEDLQVQLMLRQLGVKHDDDLVESGLDRDTLVRIATLRARAHELWSKRVTRHEDTNVLHRSDRIERGEGFGALPQNRLVRDLTLVSLPDNELAKMMDNARSRDCLARIVELEMSSWKVKLAKGRLAELLTSMPALEKLRLTSYPELPLDELARTELPKLVELDIRSNDISSAIEPLTRAVWASQLRSLNVSSNKIGDAGVRCILESGAFRNLEQLDIRGNNATPDALFGPAIHQPRLLDLDMCFIDVDDAAMSKLVRSPLFERIASLRIHSYELRSKGIEALATTCPTLRRLDLSAVECSADAFRQLVTALQLTRLSVHGASERAKLDMAAGIGVFETDPRVTSLRSLALGHLGDPELMVLARSPHLRSLRQLTITTRDVVNEGAIALAHAELPDLMKLAISKVSSAASEAWTARAKDDPLLRDLYLGAPSYY